MEVKAVRKIMHSVLLCHMLFMEAYIILRYILPLMLVRFGHTQDEAYSITTGAFTSFAICSFIWGILSNRLPACEKLIFFGVLGNFLAFLSLVLAPLSLHIVGITLYIVGSSLYFLNITILINKMFQQEQSRLQANHLYMICMNFGSLVGNIIIAIFLDKNYSLVFFFGVLFNAVTLLMILIKFKRKFDRNTKKSTSILFVTYFIMVVLVWFLVAHAALLRYITFLIFTLVSCYILYQSIKYKKFKYINFLLMLWLCSLPYWLGSSVFYSQFAVFLHTNITSYGISPLTILILNPIVGVLFGSWYTHYYKIYRLTPCKMLLSGLTAVSASFLILTICLLSNKDINIIFPILSLIIYVAGEFVTSTTLTSEAGALLSELKNGGIFVAMINISRAFATSCSYYFLTESSSVMTRDNNLQLYLETAGCILVSAVCYYLVMNFISKNKLDHYQLQ